MNKTMRYVVIIFSFLLLLIFATVSSADNTKIPFNMDIKLNGTGVARGNATFFIYDNASSGLLLYDENFTNSINEGLGQAIFGHQNKSLALTAGNTYFLDIFLNAEQIDLNFTVNGSTVNRMPFVAPVSAWAGINVTNASITGSDVDDTLNVSSGGAFISRLINIGNGFNVSLPASLFRTNLSFFSTNTFSINDFFNITPATSSIRTNGTVTITNTDLDDALNVSGGSTFNGSVTINGTAIINGTAVILSGQAVTNANYDWVLLTWRNLSIDASQNVTGFSNARLHRLDYEFFENGNREDSNASDTFGTTTLEFSVNNITNSNGYDYRTSAGISSDVNITLGGFGSDIATKYLAGSLYIYQYNSTAMMIFTPSPNLQGMSNSAATFFSGSYNFTGAITPAKLSELNFVTDLGANSARHYFNGSYRLYRSTSFN